MSANVVRPIFEATKMDVQDWILSVMMPMVSGFTGWLVGRRKREVEIEGEELRNVKDTLEIYMKMIEDLKTHQRYLEERLNELMSENSSLKEKLLSAKERIDSLEKAMKK